MSPAHARLRRSRGCQQRRRSGSNRRIGIQDGTVAQPEANPAYVEIDLILYRRGDGMIARCGNSPIWLQRGRPGRTDTHSTAEIPRCGPACGLTIRSCSAHGARGRCRGRRRGAGCKSWLPDSDALQDPLGVNAKTSRIRSGKDRICTCHSCRLLSACWSSFDVNTALHLSASPAA